MMHFIPPHREHMATATRRVVDTAFVIDFTMDISCAALTSKSQSASPIMKFYPLRRNDLSLVVATGS